MSSRIRPLVRLDGEQLRASHPRDHAALSASAGTGKTHVLTARVLRLLLRESPQVDPSSILCLTFTKAGAAEMAERIHSRLAYWVRLKDSELAKELMALNEDPGPETRDHARTLFARVLDATGGGLRIETIHAFAQSLLAAFPAEAGLVPGFRPLEGREEQLLSRSTLADLLVRAESGGDLSLIADMQALSLRLGEGGAESFLKVCARAPDAMTALGPREGIEARLRHVFDLPVGDIEEAIAGQCGDALFDMAGLRGVGAANRLWGTATGQKAAEIVERWCAASPAERAAAIDDLAGVVLTKTGELRKAGSGLLKAAPDYVELAGRLAECCAKLLQMRALAGLVRDLAAGLRAGQAFAASYAEAKRAVGAVDFDDLIRRAEELLATPGMGDWVRYKLDRRTDHILVDEAQDTNERQWTIVDALVSEFFAGEGAVGRHRTIFTVGDFKQAIFGFQGTNPREFERARAYFEAKAKAVRQAAIDADFPQHELPPDFLDLSMDRSFRSAPQVLEVVDQVIANLGHEALGLPRPPRAHESHHSGRPGSVTLWQPYSVETDEDLGEEGWVSEATRAYASKLARQVRDWLKAPFWIESRGRPLRPEDILILVRRRGDLASVLVARLHAEGVPVAGVDRLLLAAPLAVRDLLAAARFAVQPLDDLNLASLLVSPVFGWDQDRLYAVAHGRPGALWPHLRAHAETLPETLRGLLAILAMADFATPHSFFETLLSGPLDGRRKLLERLGQEARDPIEELLSSALEFETRAASLQAFLDWFARGDVEIVRDPSGPRDAVRVMTVHGSKGLQSPVLILADACADPDRGGGPGGKMAALEIGGEKVPVFRPKKDELAEPLKGQVEAQDRLDREEHWRLLYVALTRAEERLYIGGALGVRDRNGPAEASWHRAVESALTGLDLDWQDAPLWGKSIVHGPAPVAARPSAVATTGAAPPLTPIWLRTLAPEEARPPRPLAPSAVGEDDVPNPPPGPDMRRAAERGRLLHQLFERLPGIAPGERRDLADRWLAHAAGVSDAAQRADLIADACRVIEDSRFADLFSADALAEAPIAAVVGEGLVVAGTVDRLLVRSDRILVADFKTGRRAPLELAEIPPAHLRQMAVYRAALRVIFPDRRVEAALLYTAAPILHALPDALLDEHLPAGG